MAAGRIQRPGSEFGPCKDACEHIDCAATKNDAATICYLCGTEIGYEVRYSEDGKRLVHAVCLENKYEAKS